jgi:hypothetical protein
MISPSALNFLIVAAFTIIFMFMWRNLAARWSERPIGQAMGSIA